MAVVTIITKKNSTPGVVPSPGNLVEGELAVNTTDKKLYTLDNGGNVVLLASGSAYTVPVTVTVTNNSTPAVTVTQNGNGGGMRVTNTGTGNSFVVEDAANPDSSPFIIDNAGRIIDGHTSALTNYVDYGGTSRTPEIQLNGLSVSLASQTLTNWSNSAISPPVLFLSKSKSNTVGTQGVVASGDALGAVQFNGDDGTNFITAALITAQVDGTPGTNDMPGRLIFATTPDGASVPTERMRITSTGALAIAGAANYGTVGQALISAGNAAPVWTDQFSSITFVFNAGGVTLSTGISGDLTIPFGCVITEWTLLADQTGSIAIDIWKDTYANYPPTVADTITGSAKPTITTGVKGQSSTLTGWTTTINSGDTLRFNIDTVSLITRVTLSLKVRRT